MKKAKQTEIDLGMTKPAMSREADENRLIALATQEAERQMRAGTASPSVIVHYLKLGTEKERIERDILEKQRDLLVAKTEALQSQKRVEELYSEVLIQMKRYSGQDVDDEDYYDE